MDSYTLDIDVCDSQVFCVLLQERSRAQILDYRSRVPGGRVLVLVIYTILERSAHHGPSIPLHPSFDLEPGRVNRSSHIVATVST